MLLDFLILFFVALMGGLLTFLLPPTKSNGYRLTLVFAGGYLFSVTIIHILPELFAQSKTPTYVGAFVLLGFFMQQVLESLTSGVEHGHMHAKSKDHDHKIAGTLSLMVGLALHGFLEGGLLAHPSTIHAHHSSNTLLFGILLHKAPAAFALMSMLTCQMKNQSLAVVLLVVFSLTSPMGLLVSDMFVEQHYLSEGAFTLLFAVVSGSFLHISTTIVFESSVEHRLNIKKLSAALLGAVLAVLAELLY